MSLLTAARGRIATSLLLTAGLVLAAAPSDATVPAAPTVNSCHNYSIATYFGVSDASRPVSCAGSFDARTDYVGHLSTNEAYTTLVNDQKINTWIGNICWRPFLHELGPLTHVAMTGFEGASFLPTQSQYAAGARWFRCDVVLPGSTRLYPLPHTLPIAERVTSSDEKCQFNYGGHFYDTACAGPHIYRAAGYFQVNSATDPSLATVNGWATSRCPAITHTTGDRAVRPVPALWADGYRFITCLKPDRY